MILEIKCRHAVLNNRLTQISGLGSCAEVRAVSDTTQLRALTEAELLHPNPDGVRTVVHRRVGFFLASDKVQVKNEMLRHV